MPPPRSSARRASAVVDEVNEGRRKSGDRKKTANEGEKAKVSSTTNEERNETIATGRRNTQKTKDISVLNVTNATTSGTPSRSRRSKPDVPVVVPEAPAPKRAKRSIGLTRR